MALRSNGRFLNLLASSRGFSLIELMVAILILAIIGAGVVAASSVFVSNAKRARDLSTSTRDLRQASTIISRVLTNADRDLLIFTDVGRTSVPGASDGVIVKSTIGSATNRRTLLYYIYYDPQRSVVELRSNNVPTGFNVDNANDPTFLQQCRTNPGSVSDQTTCSAVNPNSSFWSSAAAHTLVPRAFLPDNRSLFVWYTQPNAPANTAGTADGVGIVDLFLAAARDPQTGRPTAVYSTTILMRRRFSQGLGFGAPGC